MTRYDFDLRDGDNLAPDRLGAFIVHVAQEEAARSLADLAKEAIRSHRIDGAGGLLSVEVRDDEGAGPASTFLGQREPIVAKSKAEHRLGGF